MAELQSCMQKTSNKGTKYQSSIDTRSWGPVRDGRTNSVLREHFTLAQGDCDTAKVSNIHNERLATVTNRNNSYIIMHMTTHGSHGEDKGKQNKLMEPRVAVCVFSSVRCMSCCLWMECHQRNNCSAMLFDVGPWCWNYLSEI